MNRISLDQWSALVSVVESGSYAKAGEQLHKSQSTLTYSIQQIEKLLGVKLPQDMVGAVLMPVRALCVAAPSHPLHQLGRLATLDDLHAHRHLVIRDSGVQRTRAGGWLNERRWTVSHKATSIHAVTLGFGFAWFPEDWIRGELERGALAPVPLREGAERKGSLYLVFADRDAVGPGALRLAEIIRAGVATQCAAQRAA